MSDRTASPSSAQGSTGNSGDTSVIHDSTLQLQFCSDEKYTKATQRPSASAAASSGSTVRHTSDPHLQQDTLKASHHSPKRTKAVRKIRGGPQDALPLRDRSSRDRDLAQDEYHGCPSAKAHMSRISQSTAEELAQVWMFFLRGRSLGPSRIPFVPLGILLPRRLGICSALDEAVRCLIATAFPTKHIARGVSIPKMHYGRAIQHIREAMDLPSVGSSEEILCAITLLQMYEVRLLKFSLTFAQVLMSVSNKLARRTSIG